MDFVKNHIINVKPQNLVKIKPNNIPNIIY